MRARWAVAALLVHAASLVVVFITLAAVTPRDVPHDDHYAVAMLLIATFQSLAVAVTVLSSLALAMAFVGIVRARERGVVPALAVMLSLILVICGIAGFRA